VEFGVKAREVLVQSLSLARQGPVVESFNRTPMIFITK
jgi:hypothetical protein